MRGFNGDHSNSYLMHKLTELFCLTIFFAKFNILASFKLHFLMEQGHSVPSHKVWREAFHGRWGTNCFGSIYWGNALHGGLMVRSIANHEGIYT